MKKYSFTLIELIVSIVVIGILAAIVIVQLQNFKERSISTNISANTKEVQSAVDRYFLSNETYPIVNGNEVNLLSPYYVDTKRLAQEGYFKKDIDLNKFSEQHYKIDVFGRVWGASQPSIENTSLILKEDSLEQELTVSVDKDMKSLIIYEVTNGLLVTSEEFQLKSLFADKQVSKNNKITFKKINTIKNNGKTNYRINIQDSTKVYLLGGEDKYGLEVAPVGIGYDSEVMKPIRGGEGEYEYTLENKSLKEWLKFITVEDKPEGSKIEYEFAIKSERNGSYGEWFEGFPYNQKSYGIKVKIKMTRGENGSKASLYSLRILYHTDGKSELDPMVLTGVTPNLPERITKETLTPNIMEDPNILEDEEELLICPSSNVSPLEKEGYIVLTYSYKLDEGKIVSKIEIPHYESNNVVKTIIEHAYPNGNNERVSSYLDIPSGSCVYISLFYEMEYANWTPPTPPVIEKRNKHEEKEIILSNPSEVIGDIVSSNPNGENPSIGEEGEELDPIIAKEVNSANWVTVDTLRFFQNGTLGQTRWLDYEKSDEQIENKTRLLYLFATSDEGVSWTKLTDEFPRNQSSNALLVNVYLQVHKDYVEDNSIPDPKLNWIKIKSSDGEYDLSLDKPSLIIYPAKQNNSSKANISTESVVNWKYKTVDPNGLDIQNIEWNPSSFEDQKYTVGNHSIQARAQNSEGVWSNWSTYRFTVLEEKPVAKFSLNDKNGTIYTRDRIAFDTSASFDPDGDNIVEYEWQNKEDVYLEEGQVTISLRVKDSEGYWSDWTSKTIRVLDVKNTVFSGVGNESFDKNDSTKATANLANVTWDRDISGKTIKVVISPTLEQHYASLRFRNASNQDLSFHHLNGGATTKVETQSPTTFYVKVPDGATKLFIEGKTQYGGNTNVHIHTVELVNPEEQVSSVTGLTYTATSKQVKLNWTAVAGAESYNVYRNGSYMATVTGTGYTSPTLATNQAYTHSVIAVSKKALSNPVTISTPTLSEYVNFRGIDLNALDNNDGTYATVGNVNSGLDVTWDTNIVGKTLKVVIAARFEGYKGKIQFKDNNGNLLYSYHSTGSTATSHETTNTTATTYYIKVPMNAKKLYFEGATLYGEKTTLKVYTIQLVNPDFDVERVSNLTRTDNANKTATYRWENPEGATHTKIFLNTKFVTTVTGNTFTTPVLNSGSYTYQFVSAKNNALSDVLNNTFTRP